MLIRWARWWMWRVHWRGTWFHLGRAIVLDACSINGDEKGKMYAKEVYERWTK